MEEELVDEVDSCAEVDELCEDVTAVDDEEVEGSPLPDSSMVEDEVDVAASVVVVVVVVVVAVVS